jgi:Isoprenylcysteine carboxyl methyltransferase (ICMT) family
VFRSIVVAEIIRLFERIFLLTLSGMAIWRLWPVMGEHPQIILLLAGEFSAVFFLLIQRRGSWSSSLYATAIAFGGSGAALCIAPGGITLAPDQITLPLIMVGTTISLFAKLSLRRSFGVIPANRGVKVSGAYRFVRHPMYSGYVISHIGMLLLYFSAWNAAIYAVAWILLYLRAIEEERFLLNDPEYSAYAGQVKARIIPGLI